MKRKGISTRRRFIVLERDKFRCFYCGAPASRRELEVDHIIPAAEGGNDSLENLVTACWRCNAGKSAKLIKNPTLFQIDVNRKKMAPSANRFGSTIKNLNIPDCMREVLQWMEKEFGVSTPLICLIAIREKLEAIRSEPEKFYGTPSNPAPSIKLEVLKPRNKSGPKPKSNKVLG